MRFAFEGEGSTTSIDLFLQARCVASRHYRDIAPAFLGWLAETGWGQATWPFLRDLRSRGAIAGFAAP